MLIALAVSNLIIGLTPENASDYIYAVFFLICCASYVKVRWWLAMGAMILPTFSAMVRFQCSCTNEEMVCIAALKNAGFMHLRFMMHAVATPSKLLQSPVPVVEAACPRGAAMSSCACVFETWHRMHVMCTRAGESVGSVSSHVFICMVNNSVCARWTALFD